MERPVRCDVDPSRALSTTSSSSVLHAVRKQLSMRKELSEVTLPLWLQYLERWLERAGTTFFVGEEITICDLVIYTRMKWLRRGVRLYAKARSSSNSLRYSCIRTGLSSFVRMYVWQRLPKQEGCDAGEDVVLSPLETKLNIIHVAQSSRYQRLTL